MRREARQVETSRDESQPEGAGESPAPVPKARVPSAYPSAAGVCSRTLLQ